MPDFRSRKGKPQTRDGKLFVEARSQEEYWWKLWMESSL